jgi:hypothetical protein
MSPPPRARRPLHPVRSVPPTAEPRTESSKSHKLPPVVFYAGLGGTLLLAGATAYFAVGTRSKHESFENAGCKVSNFAPCEDLKDEGEQQQRAANIGFIATPIVAIATVVVGVAFTDWGRPVVAIHPSGTRFGWEARF